MVAAAKNYEPTNIPALKLNDCVQTGELVSIPQYVVVRFLNLNFLKKKSNLKRDIVRMGFFPECTLTILDYLHYNTSRIVDPTWKP